MPVWLKIAWGISLCGTVWWFVVGKGELPKSEKAEANSAEGIKAPATGENVNQIIAPGANKVEQINFNAPVHQSFNLTEKDSAEKVAKEFDDPIRKSYLILTLSDTNKFAAFCPFNGIFRIFSGTPIDKKVIDFEFHDAIGRHSNRCSYASVLSVNSSVVKAQTVFWGDQTISQLGLLVPLWHDKVPFRKLQDLNYSRVNFAFSKDLASKIKMIEFVVNGWVLFRKTTEDTSWRTENNGTLTLLAPLTDTLRPPDPAFDINLRKPTIEFIEKLSGPISLTEGADEVGYRLRQ